ncbi:hypothetical protein BVI434_870004 [Burkholderia vietnamiensis]|nr:hypothetical protein BVI434_870004 [Burkholderia vietnamiensis]
MPQLVRHELRHGGGWRHRDPQPPANPQSPFLLTGSLRHTGSPIPAAPLAAARAATSSDVGRRRARQPRPRSLAGTPSLVPRSSACHQSVTIDVNNGGRFRSTQA